jgi:hypothetical protein
LVTNAAASSASLAVASPRAPGAPEPAVHPPQFKAGTTALFDMLAQHSGILTAVKEPWHNWHEACPNNRPRCVIKEVNGAPTPVAPR